MPFAAGGATDVVARLLAQKLTEAWGQPVVVENKRRRRRQHRRGRGGEVARATATRSSSRPGAIVTANPHMYKSLHLRSREGPRRASPTSPAGPQVIAVHAERARARTWASSSRTPRPTRRSVNFGSAGIGTQTHLAAENFAHAAGVDLTHVPYKGESAAITDLLGGQIQLVTPNLAAARRATCSRGKIRALAVTSRERNAQLPDVPAASETLPGFENAGWFGLMAPDRHAEGSRSTRIQQDSAKILLSDEFTRASSRSSGHGARSANTPADFAAAIREQSARWAKVIRGSAGITRLD